VVNQSGPSRDSEAGLVSSGSLKSVRGSLTSVRASDHLLRVARAALARSCWAYEGWLLCLLLFGSLSSRLLAKVCVEGASGRPPCRKECLDIVFVFGVFWRSDCVYIVVGRRGGSTDAVCLLRLLVVRFEIRQLLNTYLQGGDQVVMSLTIPSYSR